MAAQMRSVPTSVSSRRVMGAQERNPQATGIPHRLNSRDREPGTFGPMASARRVSYPVRPATAAGPHVSLTEA